MITELVQRHWLQRHQNQLLIGPCCTYTRKLNNQARTAISAAPYHRAGHADYYHSAVSSADSVGWCFTNSSINSFNSIIPHPEHRQSQNRLCRPAHFGSQHRCRFLDPEGNASLDSEP